MSSPPPESEHEKQAEASPEAEHEKEAEAETEASPESGHGKGAEAEASPESGHGKEAEEVILKPVKPEPAAGGEEDGAFIHIKVTSQTAPDVFFRVKRDMLMRRIMEKYCGSHSLHPDAVVFLNEEGTHIRAAQTAEEAGLEDGSTIDVNIAQLGGSDRISV